jgi:hypothetical protein
MLPRAGLERRTPRVRKTAVMAELFARRTGLPAGERED